MQHSAILLHQLSYNGTGGVVTDKPDSNALHAIVYDDLITGIGTDASRQKVRVRIE
jgi:hypothetical protein